MSRGHRVLILGANGQVGTELQRSFADAGEITAWDRKVADLSQPETLRDLIRHLKPSIILNAAAYTAVDKAESDLETVTNVNGIAPRVLAEEAAALDALFVHYSTDYVFDGSKSSPWVENDTTNPLNAYGRTKLAGEHGIQEAGGRYLIFRTSWVYGPHGANFLRTMLRLGRERDQLRIVADQTGTPTSSIAIANATRAAVDRALADKSPCGGLYHFTCTGQTSWCDFAQTIFDRFLSSSERKPVVTPIKTEEYPTPATRPKFSVLSNQKLHDNFGITLPNWQTALAEVQKVYPEA